MRSFVVSFCDVVVCGVRKRYRLPLFVMINIVVSHGENMPLIANSLSNPRATVFDTWKVMS